MSQLIWIHEDALRFDHPVFGGSDDSPRVFIFDDTLMKQRQYSLKRLMFITETVNEMDVPIYRGDTIDVIKALANEYDATRIAVADTPDPDLQARVEELHHTFEVTVVREDPFVPEIEGEFQRFFKFWNKVKGPLLREA